MQNRRFQPKSRSRKRRGMYAGNARMEHVQRARERRVAQRRRA